MKKIIFISCAVLAACTSVIVEVACTAVSAKKAIYAESAVEQGLRQDQPHPFLPGYGEISIHSDVSVLFTVNCQRGKALPYQFPAGETRMVKFKCAVATLTLKGKAYTVREQHRYKIVGAVLIEIK